MLALEIMPCVCVLYWRRPEQACCFSSVPTCYTLCVCVWAFPPTFSTSQHKLWLSTIVYFQAHLSSCLLFVFLRTKKKKRATKAKKDPERPKGPLSAYMVQMTPLAPLRKHSFLIRASCPLWASCVLLRLASCSTTQTYPPPSPTVLQQKHPPRDTRGQPWRRRDGGGQAHWREVEHA